MDSLSETKYYEIMDKIKVLLDRYEAAYKTNLYYLGLANGDGINLSFNENHIPHLLGVYTDKLKMANMVRSNLSPYVILKKLVDCEITFYDISRRFDPASLFSNYIDNKLEVFTDNLKVRSDDIYAVIKYVSTRSYTTTDEMDICDYYIIRKRLKEYIVLGIVKKEDNPYHITQNYVPVTSRLFSSLDELKNNFLKHIAENQEVTYISLFRINNYVSSYDNKIFTDDEKKPELLDNLKFLSEEYHSIPSVRKDFSISLTRAANDRRTISNVSSVIGLVNDGIKSGNIINKEEIEGIISNGRMSSEVNDLIDVVNDLIHRKSVNNEMVNNSYSNIQNENSSLKEELIDIKENVINLQTANEQLQSENNMLKESNIQNEESLNILTEAFHKVEAMRKTDDQTIERQ